MVKMCVYEDHLKDRLPIAMAVSRKSYNTIINSLPKNTANQLQYKGQKKSEIFLSPRAYCLLEKYVLLEPKGVCAADKNKQGVCKPQPILQHRNNSTGEVVFITDNSVEELRLGSQVGSMNNLD